MKKTGISLKATKARATRTIIFTFLFLDNFWYWYFHTFHNEFLDPTLAGIFLSPFAGKSPLSFDKPTKVLRGRFPGNGRKIFWPAWGLVAEIENR